MKVLLTITAILGLTSTAALAEGHQGNRAAAAGLVSSVTDPETDMGTVTPSVSGKEARSSSGWGNAASVSTGKRGKPEE